MNTLTYSAARNDLSETINKVVQDRVPVIIRKRKSAVVMMSLDDYESWAETMHLLRSPKNAKRLIASIEALDGGDAVEKSMKELIHG